VGVLYFPFRSYELARQPFDPKSSPLISTIRENIVSFTGDEQSQENSVPALIDPLTQSD